ncbi:MAG: hypothetical protein HY042_11685 [Spirochaetia bacterium]|nr:hypothetical protein [Spirochaetia bacterium]
MSFTSGLRNTDERNVVGSRGSYTTDTTQTKVTQAGIRVGSGPLNLLASSSSEFSFGYDQSVTTGPYATEAFRFPFYDPISKALTQTSVSAFLGYGNLHYHSQSYSLNFGFQGGGSFLGVYMMCGLALATGSLELTSYGQDITGLASAAVTRAPVQITYVKFKSVTGLLYTVEVGPVFKISDHLGVKVGGYYQLAALMLDKPSGYYYNQGTLSELSSSIEVTSTDKRHDYGFWGVTVGVVTGL